MKVLPELYQQYLYNLCVNGIIATQKKMGLCFDILPPQIRHRRRSIVLCHAARSVMDARNGWDSYKLLRGSPKLDRLNYSSTYIQRVSFVEETPFASDKSPLKLVALTMLSVGQRESYD